MKIKCTSLLLFSLLFNCFTVSAQSWLWGQDGVDALKANALSGNVATNRTGNVYQTGTFSPSIIFGKDTLITPAGEDVFLVKYDQNGNVLWTRQSVSGVYSYGGGYSVASDDSDNSYVTGFGMNVDGYTDTTTFGSDTLEIPAAGQLFLVKYDKNGKVLWAKQPDTTLIAHASEGMAVTTDKFGHEYVTGGMGVFLIKYDRNGNIIWTDVQRTTDNDFSTYGYNVATDAFGNIFISGPFRDSLQFGNQVLYSVNTGIFIAKFDSSGNALWAQQSNNNSNSNTGIAPSVFADMSGAAYLTGTFMNSITLGSYTFTDPNDTTINFFIAKYNPGGTIAWAKEANLINGSSWGSNSICTDDSNHVYVSGSEEPVRSTKKNPSFAFGNDTVSIIDTFTYDLPSFILELDTSGKAICSSVLPAGGLSDVGISPNGITSDSTGKFVYLGGVFEESFNIGSDSLIDNTGGTNTYVGRWQSCEDKCDLVARPAQSIDICSAQSAVLTAIGGNSYSWTPSIGLSATTGDTVVANPTANITYTVIINASEGCSVMDTISVTIIPAPNKPTITVLVTGDSLISSAKSYNQWYFNDSLLNDTTPVLVIKGHSKGWYKVVVTNPANGCSTTSDSTTSIYQLSVINNQLSIYPNPFNNEITVKISPSVINVNNWSLKLYDVLGRTLYSKSSLSFNNEIDLGDSPSGMYFISVSNGAQRAVFPVVKQN